LKGHINPKNPLFTCWAPMRLEAGKRINALKMTSYPWLWSETGADLRSQKTEVICEPVIRYCGWTCAP